MEWIKSNGFGGWMLWNIDLDDFTGKYCGKGKYPFINAMINATIGSLNTTDGETSVDCGKLGYYTYT